MEEAFERKGYAKGITTCRELTQQLYAAKVKGPEDVSATSTNKANRDEPDFSADDAAESKRNSESFAY